MVEKSNFGGAELSIPDFSNFTNVHNYNATNGILQIPIGFFWMYLEPSQVMISPGKYNIGYKFGIW